MVGLMYSLGIVPPTILLSISTPLPRSLGSMVTQAWPYRPELDCVLEAPDRAFAAYVLCWYDDANHVGELEPVGTHPAYRRRGLGAAVCRYALRRLRDEGARQAIVYAGGRDQDEPARVLYESIRFRRHTRVVELRKVRE